MAICEKCLGVGLVMDQDHGYRPCECAIARAYPQPKAPGRDWREVDDAYLAYMAMKRREWVRNLADGMRNENPWSQEDAESPRYQPKEEPERIPDRTFWLIMGAIQFLLLGASFTLGWIVSRWIYGGPCR